MCLMHANCQGDALKQLLLASPDFAAKFEIRHLRNYQKAALDQGLLDSSRLFLHQYLAPKWGAISTDEVLPRLGGHCEALCIPNCFFTGYWPLRTHSAQMGEFGDMLLESLLEKGLSNEEILHIYLKGSPALFGDVEGFAQASLKREREREAHTPLKYVDFIEEHWRQEQLFLTLSHPAVPLLAHVAQKILKKLGLEPISEEFLKNYAHPHNEFWHPIHPTVGKMLNIPFATKEKRYPCFGADITHEEFTLVYLSCRRNHFDDLPNGLAAYARSLHKESN